MRQTLLTQAARMPHRAQKWRAHAAVRKRSGRLARHSHVIDGVTMTPWTVICLAAAALMLGCGAPAATLTQPLASSRASIHRAESLGASDDPQAAVHLRLAEKQVAEAMDLLERGHGERAAWVLERARSDADLAAALARENRTRARAQEAAERAEAMRRRAE